MARVRRLRRSLPQAAVVAAAGLGVAAGLLTSGTSLGQRPGLVPGLGFAPGAGRPAAEDDLVELEDGLLRHLNRARAERELSRLVAHPALEQVARERARELAGRAELASESLDINRLSARLRQLGYRPHYWREAVVAGHLEVSTLNRTEPAPELLRPHLEHAAVACEARGSGRLCLVLVAEPRLAHQLRIAEPLRDLRAVRRALLEAVNRERAGHDLDPLEPHPDADRAAQQHAEAMLELGFYGHEAPDGSGPRERARAVGYRPRRLAENIAKVVTTPDDVVARWMASSGHRRNLLLEKATEHGLGVAVGIEEGEVVALWCQLIAQP